MNDDVSGPIEGWVHEWSALIAHEIVKGIYDNHEFQTYSEGVSWYIPEAEKDFIDLYDRSFRTLSMLRKIEKENPAAKLMFDECKDIFISPLGLSDWVTSIYREAKK